MLLTEDSLPHPSLSSRSASSSCSSSTCRSAEAVTVRQPSKSRIRRHTNRLSGVFLRGPASGPGSMALPAGLRSSLSIQARKASMISTDTLVEDDPSELSNQITAPGILKIFGNEICEGAHYKSVLATTQSSAKELVKEALERYGLGKEEAESYVLCDTIGSFGHHQWRTEGFRVVGDHEKPLLLQSLWKPREGLARRFEIQKRSLVEEKTSREKDTITAGINAQARKLQKSRSRVTSTLMERTLGRGQKLWRSKSEMDLLDIETKEDAEENSQDRIESLNHVSAQSYGSALKQNHIHSLTAPSEGDGGSRAKTETLCPPRPGGEREGEESEREETESSDDNTTQYSIHPPHDCPYLLLLQGCSPAQDFVIYLLVGPNVVIGQHSNNEDGSKVDILLFASDILPRHCYFRRRCAGGPTMLCPCQDAVVMRNGEALKNDVQLSPGDVIGLGQHYLFLFKDPLSLKQAEAIGLAPESSLSAAPVTLDRITSATARGLPREIILCNTCISACTDLQSSDCREPLTGGPPFLKTTEGHCLTLAYEADDEDRVVKEIVAMGCGNDRPPLTVSFLLCLCVQYSSACLHTSNLRRLLLLIADGVQGAMWEHTKDLAAVQPEVLSATGCNPQVLRALGLPEVISGLCPLVVWMSNCLELLQFVQYQLPLILEWRVQKEREQEEEEERGDDESKEVESVAKLELLLSRVRSASEETMAVLEEVIMLAFQQCVYYITKVLYPILPGLLDCNPFRGTGESTQVLGGGGLQVPGEIQQVVEVLTESWTLLSDCQVHVEISSQLVGYLFYFINASLFNSLMERGSEPGFYQWSRGVRMRASLDLLLDWAHAAGLGELALEHTHTLSSAINLLATPRKNLVQTSWESLRSDYPALSPAQVNHLLSLYSPASPCRHVWTPSAQDRAAAHETADILESFDTHHPLVLPDAGYQLQSRRPVTDSALREQLDKLKDFIHTLSDSQLSATAAKEHQDGTVQMDANLRNAGLETSHTSAVELVLSTSPSTTSVLTPPSPPSPSSPLLTHHPHEFSPCGAVILSQRLRNLELQTAEAETSESRRSALDPSCLLTPPKTPQLIDAVDLVKADEENRMKADGETVPFDVGAHDEGGLVFECLAALKVDRLKSDCSSTKRLAELKEEEEEQDEEEEAENQYDDNNDEVFSLELERDETGLGLALVDTSDTSLKVKGIFIRTVVPDSPAGRSQKLLPGDRIMAVNGVSLLGMDYHGGRELIQSSGARLRLLVARSSWMTKAVRNEC
ncbi:ras-associating and dilute domain-containing protein-like isoform X2 [Mugil cephalus]|uniref:ras-associating and dilute domain-containing protein-like isoform X2 n=1 Tax=Mugil cephalus TaxID=48193 RepID=UPI001FB6F351|nr:ras-associating and dilute domain-containing protein-like isoform X2 [Mugil cephalus]XP_047466022.1 ras-associating and dilute domain-containing protein-like isoform X2 [Mugil cephalus]